jgi:hypothetical protein
MDLVKKCYVKNYQSSLQLRWNYGIWLITTNIQYSMLQYILAHSYYDECFRIFWEKVGAGIAMSRIIFVMPEPQCDAAPTPLPRAPDFCF